jgi:parallel beta-helix repeat protein
LTKAKAHGSVFLNKLTLNSIGDDTSGKIDVTQNSINNGIDISSLRSSSAVSSSVSNNVIKNGRLYFYSSYSHNITISDNTIQESNNGGMYIYSSDGWVSVSNNTVKSCISGWYPVVQLRSSVHDFSFRNNKVLNNDAEYIFSLEGASYLESKSDFSVNVATGNTGSRALILLSSYPWANFSRNIFNNNMAPFSVETNMPYYNDILKLPFNFWGLFQPDIIDLRQSVVDGFARASQPIVDFDPVLSGPSIMR